MSKTTAVVVAALVGLGAGFGLGYVVVSYAAKQKVKGAVASGLGSIGLGEGTAIGHTINQIAGALIDAN